MLDIAGSPSFIASHAIRKRLVPTASLFHPGTLSCSLHDRYYDLPPPPPPTPTSPPSHPCVVCFECFDTPALLESHEAMHTYQCTACNKVLLTAHQVRRPCKTGWTGVPGRSAKKRAKSDGKRAKSGDKRAKSSEKRAESGAFWQTS